MTHDRDLDPQVQAWLDELPPGPPDRNAVYARVMDRLPDTHQRRHRWPFRWNPFAAGAMRSADANGPHPRGRSTTMLNATRAMAIVTVLALTGTLALVAGPFAPAQEPAPAATLERSAADVGRFTGVMTFGPETVDPVVSIDGEVQSERGGSVPMVLTGSDERLAGQAMIEWNADTLGPGSSKAVIFSGM